MSNIDKDLKKWSESNAKPAKLNQNQMIAINALAVLFLVMAVLQLASFSEFKSDLMSLGFSRAPEAWAIGVVVAEIWAAVGLLGVRMNGYIRGFGRIFAVLASGFWFLTSLQAVTGADTPVSTMGYFGKYLTQAPGWWTVIEATVVALWTLYALEVTKKK